MNKQKFRPVSLDRVQTYSIYDRPTRVDISKLSKVCPPNPNLSQFLDSLPAILKASDLKEVVRAIAEAYRKGKPVVAGLGGHVIKCGLSPLLIQMMEVGVIQAIAMNGGASIHDFELALVGHTSEDVAASLETGMFGMVKETAEEMNHAIRAGAASDIGMGQALGQRILDIQPPYLDFSVLAAGARLGIPVTVHTVIGGDTIHMHSNVDSAALGKTTFTDFRLLTAVLQEIGDGGVYLNLGSAVVLPEVFLKAINLARNLADHPIKDFFTVNMDMIQHYRPQENVVRRPTLPGGKGYTLIGHHEIMIPLLFNLVLAQINTPADA